MTGPEVTSRHISTGHYGEHKRVAKKGQRKPERNVGRGRKGGPGAVVRQIRQVELGLEVRARGQKKAGTKPESQK